MDTFLRELYDGKPKPGSGVKQPRCHWLDILELAFNASKEAHEAVKKVVLNVQKASVKLPIIRKATKPFKYTGADEEQWTIPEGSTILCDIVRAAACHIHPSLLY